MSKDLLRDDQALSTINSNQAIEYLREYRPGSIESIEKEGFVHAYYGELWNRKSTGGVGHTPAATQDKSKDPCWKIDFAPEFSSSLEHLHVERAHSEYSSLPSLIVAVGLPGSGKSTFGKRLQAASKKNVVILSSDELGRDELEDALGEAVKKSRNNNGCVYVDRCNVDCASRVCILTLAFRPRDACVVFFDLDKRECQNRAASRLDHPSIPPGGGEKQVAFFAKRMEFPRCIEGFASVYHVKSKRALNELLKQWHVFGGKEEGKENVKEKPFAAATVVPQYRLPLFYKFPRTPHLLRMSEKSVSRDDLILDNATTWCLAGKKKLFTVEEKIDGANLGISIDQETGQLRCQNRSHYVCSKDHPQFGPLKEWLALHAMELFELLQAVEESQSAVARPTLFGEWIVATHSIVYNAIPDYFVAFDLLCSNGKFASRKKFREFITCHSPSIQTVPCLIDQRSESIDVEELKRIVTSGKSQFCKDGSASSSLEGCYVRVDEGDFLKERSKIVRADFIAGNEHWTKHSFQRNIKAFVDE